MKKAAPINKKVENKVTATITRKKPGYTVTTRKLLDCTRRVWRIK